MREFSQWIEGDSKAGDEAFAWMIAASAEAGDAQEASRHLVLYNARYRPGVGSEDPNAHLLRYRYAFKRMADEDHFIEGIIKGGWKALEE